MPEPEAIKDSPEDYELLPAKSDPKAVGEAVMEMWRKIVEEKKRLGLHDLWMKFYKLVKNLHWQAKNVSNIKLASINLTHTHIQRTVNVLTDNDPTFNVHAEGQLQPEQEDVLEDQLHQSEHWWNETEQQHRYARAVRTGEIYGITGVEVCFNRRLKKGYGEVETHVLDPYHFGWWPLELCDPLDLQGCEAFLVWQPMSVRSLRRLYPDKAKDIKPDGEVLKEMGDERRDVNSDVTREGGPTMMIKILNTIKTVYAKFGGMLFDGEDDKTLLVRCYCHDYRKDKEDNDLYKGNIRYVEVCSAGKVVLQDKSNPNISPALEEDLARQTYLWDRFPVALANSIDDTSSAWGESDLQQVEELVRELDKIISQLIYYKDIGARMKVMNPITSGVSNDEFTNEATVVNPSNAEQAQAIRWLEQPPMNQDLSAYITLFKDLFFLVAGTFELDQAQNTNGQLAFKALAALMERASTMMRGKTRNYGYLIRETGRMYMSCAQNFYNEGEGATERWLAYTNSNGDKVSKAIRGKDLIIPSNLTFVTGSTLPVSKVQQRQEALELAKMGAIDKEALLEKLDYSGKQQIIQRMKQGPLSSLLNELKEIGCPPGLIDAIGTLAKMDPKMFERAKKAGKIPPFMQILQRALTGQQPQAQTNVKEQADAMLKGEQAKKARAETALIAEQINTEKMAQAKIAAGIELDKENLVIKRAEAVADIHDAHKQRRVDAAKVAVDIQKGQINGVKSDNDKET